MRAGDGRFIAIGSFAALLIIIGAFYAILGELDTPPPGQPGGPLKLFDLRYGIELRNVGVVDGDTIHADLLLPYGIVLEKQTIRASDYDAWESRKIRRSVGPISDAEIARGKRAKEHLQRLVSDGPIYLEAPGKNEEQRDSYGRLLGKFMLNGSSIKSAMQNSGDTRPEVLRLDDGEE